jgi:hypothetical protein
MDEVKVICPLTQRILEKSCPTCNFVVIEDNQITGCAIRKNIRRMIENTNLAKETFDSFINFKNNMQVYGKN